MKALDRKLTEREERAVDLMRNFERAAELKKLIVTLRGNQEAAQIIHKLETKYQVIKVLRIAHDEATNDYVVKLTLPEYLKYADFILESVGMRQTLEGGVITSDNRYIEPDWTY